MLDKLRIVLQRLSSERSWIYELAEECFDFFNIKIDILCEDIPGENYLQNFIYYSGARYEPSKDVIILNMNMVRYLESNYEDYKRLMKFLIMHELCHAIDARAFEKEGIYPFRLKTSPSISRIIGYELFLPDFNIGKVNANNVFFGTLLDYPIDKYLYKLGLNDIMGEQRISLIRENLKNFNFLSQIEKDYIILESVFSLPLSVNYYNYGKLSNDNKSLLESYMKTMVGDKWDIAINVLGKVEFNDIKSYDRMIKDMYNIVLNQSVFRTWSFDRLKLASFWKKKRYELYHMMPILK
jgi:hypothetical protein